MHNPVSRRDSTMEGVRGSHLIGVADVGEMLKDLLIEWGTVTLFLRSRHMITQS